MIIFPIILSIKLKIIRKIYRERKIGRMVSSPVIK
jgi:hypothetical protein